MISGRSLQRFKDTYSALLVHDVNTRLRDRLLSDSSVHFTASDARFLLTLASQISLNSNFEDDAECAKWHLWAYDAATRLATSGNPHPNIIAATDIILARLGNFPARRLLQESQGERTIGLPLVLALQAESRQIENTVQIGVNAEFTLTDFQFRLFDDLRSKSAVSFSAPTSAGKSFLLGLDIVRRLGSGSSRCIVYLVPTRALIRQVTRDLRRQLSEAKLADVAVVSFPVPVDPDGQLRGVVYVLTQERLLNLLASSTKLQIDALFVDEAQEIGSDGRGLLLHSAVQLILQRSPHVQTYFSSPLTHNPDYLFSEFSIAAEGEKFVEQTPSVSQLLIFLRGVDRKPREVDVEVLTPNGVTQSGRISVDFPFRQVLNVLARTAITFTLPGETSLVYANQAADAEVIAQEITELAPDLSTPDRSVADFIAFLKVHIHPKYSLISHLLKGVAFHYGDMPHIVRTRLEDLVRERKIRFVCCTSTLLQGVNLPAKNIFISRPRRGRDRPLTSTDFWNLAGRAGRLREEFSGNVWCIEKDTWKEDPLEGPRLGTITSSFRNVLSDPIESTRLVQCIENKNLPSDLKSISELAFGKIFSEFTLPGRKLEDSIYTSTVNPVFLRQIDERCELVKQKAVLPADIFHRNSAISPWRLEAIRERLAAIADINSVVPIKPTVRGSCEILRRVFQIIDEVFFMTKNNSYTYFAALAFRWINGDTLSEIIENELNFRKIDKTDSKAINKKIRGLFDDLENQLQFRYARYLKAYVDIVEVILRTRGMNDKANDIAPMHLYIELGTYNSVMITLMSLGLSRTTSILLWRSVAKRWPPSPQECMANLLILNRKMVVLPDVCWREISDIVGS